MTVEKPKVVEDKESLKLECPYCGKPLQIKQTIGFEGSNIKTIRTKIAKVKKS